MNEGILDSLLDSLRSSQAKQSIRDMRLAKNQRAWRGAWNKTVETHGGKVGDTENPIIQGIAPSGQEDEGHRHRWRKTETDDPRDMDWIRTYRQGRAARYKPSDAVRASAERIAAGVLAGTMAFTGHGLVMTPNNAEKAMRAMPVHLRQVETGQQGEARMNLKEHYKQRLNEARGEPDTRELDRQLGLLDTAFIAGYPRGEMHRAEVARAERVRGAINPHRPGSIEMAMARGLLPAVPAELARSFLDLNKDQAAELEERPRSKSKGDPRKDPEVVQTGRMNADAFAQLSTFPTRSNPPGTIPAHLANNPALVAHHRQANAAWRYSPTGETEYYDPTRHPTNPRNLSQAARDIGRLRRGDLLGNVSREDLEKIFRLRQDHKAQRRSGGPRTGGRSLSEHRLDEGVVGKVMKKIKRTGQLLKAVFTQNLSPGQRLQINRNIRAKEQQGGTGMNLKEHYKRRLQEDLQTPERAEQMSKAVRDAEHAAQISLALGSDAEALTTRAIAKAVRDRNAMEVNDPKIVYGKGGRVVGKVVPTKGSAARTR